MEILDDDGRLNEQAQILVGQDRFVARKNIVKMLEEAGNLVKIEEYISPVGYSERTDAVIEPKLSKQWFLKLEGLAKQALESVESGKIKLIPDKYRNVYRHWMENAHDWCISRQLLPTGKLWWKKPPKRRSRPLKPSILHLPQPTCAKMKTCLTPGSAAGFGRSAFSMQHAPATLHTNPTGTFSITIPQATW